MNKLKLWNGRGDYRKLDGHLYVCATSKREAIKLLVLAGMAAINLYEMNNYWSDTWGLVMKGITPEKGVWFVHKDDEHKSDAKPRRIV